MAINLQEQPKRNRLEKKGVVFILFILLGVLFIIGSAFQYEIVLMTSNFLLVPVLLLYYRMKVKKIFLPIVLGLLLLYFRDIFLIHGIDENPVIIWISFLFAISLLYLCLFTSIQRSKVHPLEILSFLIMYCFLAFLFLSLGEVVPEALPTWKFQGYLYLLLLMLLVAFSFTSYLMKSHMASLWFLIASSAFLMSELSFFFKVFILEDFSVNLFYPFFHVLAYYGFIEYAERRRLTGRLPYF